jgi:penicillin-binding protein 1A
MGGALFLAHHPWVDFSVLAQYNPGKPSILLDDQGKEWARFQLDKRDPIKLSDVPKDVIHAFLAAEDRSFYQHGGISIHSMIRAMLTNLYHGRKAQGASTITQQLVKLLFFDNKKTFTRKIKEQLLALITEQQFTKDQILETYLNHIYFGCGIYGIEAAAQRFWQKHVAELTIEEAATLAGIIRSPNRYCPLDNPENARKRRNVVLWSLKEAGYLDATRYAELIKKPLGLSTHEPDAIAPHFKEMLRCQLEEMVGKQLLYHGGLTIQTTLNRTMQQAATQEFMKQMREIRLQIPHVDGALVSIECTTGDIKAMIGGVDYKHSQFNRATQAQRQMGSTFKPIIYAAALERGAQCTDIYIDEPLAFFINNKIWEPRNVQKRFDGPMTLAYSLITSRNSVPLKLLLESGIQHIIEKAQKFKLRGPFQPYPSLALGCVDSTPLEVAGMFNVFAHGGTYVAPHAIVWIKNSLGEKIWKHMPQPQKVLSWSVSSQIAQVLIESSRRWQTLVSTSFPSCELMGKTGTTNDARTCWFVGSTPNYTTAIYIGLDDSRPMGSNVYGVRTALPLWLSFNVAIPQLQTKFNHDPRLKEILVDALTGQPTDAHNPQALSLLIDPTVLGPRYRIRHHVWQDQLLEPYAIPRAAEQQTPEHSPLDDQLTPSQEELSELVY